MATEHWHVWLAGEPPAGRPVSMLRRITRPFYSRQAGYKWAKRREPDTSRWLVRSCQDPLCREHRRVGRLAS